MPYNKYCQRNFEQIVNQLAQGLDVVPIPHFFTFSFLLPLVHLMACSISDRSREGKRRGDDTQNLSVGYLSAILAKICGGGC